MRDFFGNYIINNPIFWIIVFGFIIVIFLSKEIKNSNIIRKTLKRLPKDKYMILNDVELSSARKDHKIDTVIISSFGIFVIKYVKISGKVYGDEREDKWILLNGSNKSYFDNPIKEVHSSIRVLSEVLDLNEKYFIPITCFIGDTVISCDTKDKLTQIEFLDDTIKTYRKEILKYGLKEIRNKIKDRSKITGSINSPVKSEERNSTRCPKCGGKLVVRKGKYGDFMGCSNYPECKYTKEI